MEKVEKGDGMMNNKSLFYEQKSEVYGISDEIGPAMKVILEVIKNRGLKILDVGCARGNLGRYLKERGNFVYGVEISKTMGTEAKNFLDDVVIGDIEEIDLPWPRNFFDVIVCNNILEHLFDPKATLFKLRKYLKESGMIIVGLPNIANWQIIKNLIFGKFEYTRTGLLDNGHIRFFTPSSATKLLEECGYTPVKVIPTVINFPIRRKMVQSLVLKVFRHIFIYHFIIVAKKEGNGI